jgi:hypothetical protein
MTLHQSRQHIFTNGLLDCPVSQAATPVHKLPLELDSDTTTPSLLQKPSDISTTVEDLDSDVSAPQLLKKPSDTSIENEQAFDFKQILRDLMKR